MAATAEYQKNHGELPTNRGKNNNIKIIVYANE